MANEARNQECGLLITRVFDAPRDAVWRAWTEPASVRQWWGPKSYTAPSIKSDLHVGGRYLYCLRSPDGKDFWSAGIYREVIRLEKIVATDTFADAQGNVVPASHYGMSPDFPLELQVTVTFTHLDGKTLLAVRQVGVPAGRVSELTAAGWAESFDKLAAVLAAPERQVAIGKTTFLAEPGKQEVTYTREFGVPRERVFGMYLDPEKVPQWWGPRSLTTRVDKMEVRPGGQWRFVQHDNEGKEHAFRGVYHSIRAPEQVVWTFEYEPMPGHVSFETTTFEEHDGSTKLTGRSVFQSVGDRDGMLKWKMREGLAESMDRLAELVVREAPNEPPHQAHVRK